MWLHKRSLPTQAQIKTKQKRRHAKACGYTNEACLRRLKLKQSRNADMLKHVATQTKPAYAGSNQNKAAREGGLCLYSYTLKGVKFWRRFCEKNPVSEPMN